MSNLDFLYESYEIHNEKLFSIPEDARYPILDEGDALWIFKNKTHLENPQIEEDYFLGESVHELRLSDDVASEFELNIEPAKKSGAFSPKIEETHYEEHAVKNAVSLTPDWVHPPNANDADQGQKILQNFEDIKNTKIQKERAAKQKIQQNTMSKPVVQEYRRSRFGRQIKPEIKPEMRSTGYKNLNSKRKVAVRHKSKIVKIQSNEDDSSIHKGINLAKRKDVINKTLLRSIKRYYTCLFDKFGRENKFSKQQRKESWMELIDEFTKSMYSDLDGSNIVIDKTTQEGIKAFMASMITPNSIKRSNEDRVYIQMLDDFSSLLYKYSIKKLKAFVWNPAVSYVLRHFNQNGDTVSKSEKLSKNQMSEMILEQGPFQIFLDSDPTLSKNKLLYIKAWKEIIQMTD